VVLEAARVIVAAPPGRDADAWARKSPDPGPTG
jgi:hypothetical protein